jgi:hypothetical protein
MKAELDRNLLVKPPLRRYPRELPTGIPEYEGPRRSVSEPSALSRSKIWETACWLQGSISSVQGLRWPMWENSSYRRSQHMNLFRWLVVSRRSLCVGNRSPREFARDGDAGESRQNLPSLEVRSFRRRAPHGASINALSLALHQTGKVRDVQSREVLPRFLGRGFLKHSAPKIVSTPQSRYRSGRSPRGITTLPFSFFSSLHQPHV